MRTNLPLEEVKKSFDLAAGRYKFLSYTLQERAKRIRRYMPPGSKVLDVGIASGELAKTYSNDLDLMFVGFDVSDKMLLLSKDKLGMRNLIVGIGQKMPFASGTFDCVVSSEALYYMSDPENFLAEVWRILKEGGKIVIVNRNQLWHFLEGLRKHLKIGADDPLLSRLNLYYPKELRKMLKDSGFSNVKSECFCVIPLPGFGFIDRTPLSFLGHIFIATGIKR